MIEYPRACDTCKRVYKSQPSYSNHKKRCYIYAAEQKIADRKVEAEVERRLGLSDKIPITQNNIQNNQQINNNVVINVNSQAEATSVLNTLAPSFQKSHTQQQIKAMKSALGILFNDGVKTPEELHTVIQTKTITIQQLEQDVADCEDYLCHNALRQGEIEARKEGKKLDGNSKEYLDLHLKHSALHLFRNLVTDKTDEDEDVEYHITMNKLISNPLYLSNDGLSAWSQESGIKQNDEYRKIFGKLDKSERCRWLSVNDKLLWGALIMNVLLERLRKWMKIQSTNEYDDLIERYRNITARCEEEETFVAPIMKEMKKCLAENCRELHIQGWRYLTDYVSQQSHGTEDANKIEG